MDIGKEKIFFYDLNFLFTKKIFFADQIFCVKQILENEALGQNLKCVFCSTWHDLVE